MEAALCFEMSSARNSWVHVDATLTCTAHLSMAAGHEHALMNTVLYEFTATT